MTTSTPNRITATQADLRVREIRDFVASGYIEDARRERAQLYLDVLWTIVNAPDIAEVSEIRRLANLAMEASELEIPE